MSRFPRLPMGLGDSSPLGRHNIFLRGLNAWGKTPKQKNVLRVRTNANSASNGSADAGAKWRAGIWKSMVTTASLGMTGDLVAQSIGRYKRVKELKAAGVDTSDLPLLDFKRFFKMATFGFFYYGPLQGVWYPALDKTFPVDRALPMVKNLFPFGMKVTLNQVLLGPMVVPVVFAWTLILEKQTQRIPEKIRKDTWPTLIKGW
eukprot:CAMPEP_0118933912 /NCGR_PEP_ID=MMETSP1169-20130426/12974_1 /TAXON_ID=36882 /ORGANISM="Pyramimonas obovata, Strain CCMP722" /LENGTH=202 /DNA_ID=CAMNT_0006876743 /DNA_START=113 /DNA_END=718 /DNA_ORIENTATION=+